jgi:PTS system nitrogen regulatory IIA component
MEIAELIKPDQIVIGLDVTDKSGLLFELAMRASRACGVAAESILKALTAREALGSTGMGQGIALPHASIEGLKKPFGCLARLEHSVDFEAIDGEPVDLVFLLLTPPAARNQNVAILAAISRRLRDRTVLQELRTGKSAPEIYKALVGLR